MQTRRADMPNTRKTTYVAMLFAVAIAIAFLEQFIPALVLPPFVKPGFSNIVLMFTAISIGAKEAVLLALLKALFAFLTRGFTAGLMSFSGGIFSVLCIMFLLCLFKSRISLLLLSVLSALAHNAAQLAVSSLLLQSLAAFYYMPILFIFAVFTGSLNAVLLRSLSAVLANNLKV